MLVSQGKEASMQYGAFLRKVQDRIGPTQGSAASDEASLAITATLEALGECIPVRRPATSQTSYLRR